MRHWLAHYWPYLAALAAILFLIALGLSFPVRF
jgi:hypothetical protein